MTHAIFDDGIADLWASLMVLGYEIADDFESFSNIFLNGWEIADKSELIFCFCDIKTWCC